MIGTAQPVYIEHKEDTMSWQKRGAGKYLYLYRGRNANGHPLYSYIGTGVAATVGELLEVENRVKRIERRDRERNQREQVKELFNLGRQMSAAIAIEVQSEMASRGFHQHARGEWRRARGGRIATNPLVTKNGGHNGFSVQVEGRMIDACQVPIGDAEHPSTARADAIQLTRRALDGWIALLAGNDQQAAAGLRRDLQIARRRFLAEGNSNVERLLVDRILVCRLQVDYCDLAIAATADATPKQVKFFNRRLNAADWRLVVAVKNLVTVRGLLSRGGGGEKL